VCCISSNAHHVWTFSKIVFYISISTWKHICLYI
jgi:hypothetical protein